LGNDAFKRTNDDGVLKRSDVNASDNIARLPANVDYKDFVLERSPRFPVAEVYDSFGNLRKVSSTHATAIGQSARNPGSEQISERKFFPL